MSKEFEGDFVPITDFYFSADSVVPQVFVQKVIAHDVKPFGGKPTFENAGGFIHSVVSPINIFDGNDVFARSTFEVKQDATGEHTTEYILTPILTEEASGFFKRVVDSSNLERRTGLALNANWNMPYVEFEGREKGISLNLPNGEYIQRIGGKTFTFADNENLMLDQTYFLKVKAANQIEETIEPGDTDEAYYSTFTVPFNVGSFPVEIVESLGNNELVATLRIINFDSDTIYTMIDEAQKTGKLNESLLRTIANIVIDIKVRNEAVFEEENDGGGASSR